MTQYPTQAARMVSGDVPPSQLLHESQSLKKLPALTNGKRARHPEDDSSRDLPPAEVSVERNAMACKMRSTRNNILEDRVEGLHAVPDVAAAIEDLLAQSNKIQDMKSPGRSCDRSIFSPDRSILGQDHTEPCSGFGISKPWLKRTEKQDNHFSPSEHDNQRTFDGFSETQTESQVVGYEEDLSGRQMIIERCRTRSSA